MGEITISKKTWKKIRSEAKKRKKFPDGRIAGCFKEEQRKCPIRMDFDHDSKEEIARKWEEIKKWNKEHPEASNSYEWEAYAKSLQGYLPSKFYQSSAKSEKKEERKVNELDKLEEMLKEKNIPYNRVDEAGVYGHHRIDVFNNDGDRIWDAICQRGSYGYDDGLLEVMGDPVVKLGDGDSVCGYLTAKDVIERYEKYQRREFDDPRYCLKIETDDRCECYDEQAIDEVADVLKIWNEHYVLIPNKFYPEDLVISFKAYKRKDGKTE